MIRPAPPIDSQSAPVAPANNSAACDCRAPESVAENAADTAPMLATEALGVSVGGRVILRDVSLRIAPRQVYGLVGPSGAGKSTLLRAFNRLLDLQPGYTVSGRVLFKGRDVRAPGEDADTLRRRVGMVFQQPAVFPTSIAANVVFGARHHTPLPKAARAELVETSLRQAGLWNEVKDRLAESALRLSVGQQQRLCLARTLAVDPEVVLMDEPTSALDARSTELIEQLILELKRTRTVVLVTHNLEQARRVTDWVTCLCPDADATGRVLDSACCDAFFSDPACLRAFA